MTLEELVGTCAKCGGTGKRENPILQQSRQGYGTRVIAATPVDCDECQGRGVLFTADGDVLLQFFRLVQSKGLLGRG